ncbi:MAG: hypothetical protein JW957_06450 [Candidatus Omnitrophica bacterium]|nr:hypothetical protein [Candidatus Omnitrophota bacterium]
MKRSGVDLARKIQMAVVILCLVLLTGCSLVRTCGRIINTAIYHAIW